MSLGVMKVELLMTLFKSLALFCIRLCYAISIIDLFYVLLITIIHLFLFTKCKYWTDARIKIDTAKEILPDQKDNCIKSNAHFEKMSEAEVKMVMERLGICYHEDGGKIQDQVGTEEIETLFDEKEPSLEEMKETFEVFDANNDGYIDAKELRKIISGLGFVQVSESVCQNMIISYDDDGDGRINFSEFVKLFEKS